jgi:outer membrane immunogenic protein
LAQTITTGFLGGGQIGFNYQTGPVVWGAEAQLSWSDISGTCALCVFQAQFNSRLKTDWLTTAAARVGFVHDRTMIFVKGGGAWARNEYEASYFFPFARPDIPNLDADETRGGWMLGTGVEHAFYGNWSAKVEYDYIDLGTKTVDFGLNASFTDPGVTVTYDIRQRIHLVKFGLNFRFGGWSR